jgi:PIN domain nuclease of toxin-antitoxin system
LLPLPVNLAHAQLAGHLATEHSDPFDRMLAARTVIERVPIVSNDEAFDLLGVVRPARE